QSQPGYQNMRESDYFAWAKSLDRRFCALAERQLEALESVDWTKASPLDVMRGAERAIALERLVLGMPMSAEQVRYHLGPDEQPAAGPATEATASREAAEAQEG